MEIQRCPELRNDGKLWVRYVCGQGNLLVLPKGKTLGFANYMVSVLGEKIFGVHLKVKE